MEMIVFLFSKAQNHLCRKSDGHGIGRASHSYLRSLRRPHPLHHLENFHPKHQQWRKGTMSPKSFRAVESRLEAPQVYPRPSSLWHVARWDVVIRSHSISCNLPPRACLVVIYSASSHSGMGTLPCLDCHGHVGSGHGQVRRVGEEAIVNFWSRLMGLWGPRTNKILGHQMMLSSAQMHPGKCLLETPGIRMRLLTLFLASHTLMLYALSAQKLGCLCVCLYSWSHLDSILF